MGQLKMFFTPGAKKVFIKLKQVFVEAPIQNYFDLEHHIQIETDISDHAIGRTLNQLTLDDSSWWHPVVFFFRKMIPAETQYETHNGKFMAIIEVLKMWRHYLEGYRYKVLVLTNQNNL